MTSFWLPDETGFSYRNGALFCEDVPVTELADKYGTPSFIYSRKAIETAFRDYDGAFGSHPHHILYSVKACSNIGIISLLAKLGSGFDIVSGGELLRVEAAGGDLSKVVYSGVGKTDKEIMDFCQSFMTELCRHIGPSIDVPAGDMGVGGREIGYLFGQYKRIRGAYENGVLTGKGLSFGGSLIRPEATGFGAVYYLCEVLKHENDTIEGKTVAVSGFGNVAWGVTKKVAELGGKVVTLSGPDGYIYDPDGVVTEEKINYMLEMNASRRNRVQDYADKFGVEFFPGEKPFGRKVDIVMPCAMQNDVHMESAEKIVANGIKYYIEVANMPTTNDALYFMMDQPGMIVAPSKAVNAGGVAVSGLEMSQNAERLAWTAEEVDAKLRHIMVNIHKASMEAAEECGLGYNLVAGANIAGFKKVADAMMAQGIC